MIKDGDNLPEIPPKWVLTKLGDIIHPSDEKVAPITVQKIPYIGLEHIEKDTGKLLNSGDSGEVKSTKSKFYTGDLLYGKLRPYLNKVHVVNFAGICSTDILVFSKNTYVSNKYLAFRLLCRDFVRYANQNVNGVQHPRVSFKAISEFPVLLPPLNEQRRIVTKIEELMSRSQRVKEALEAIPPLLDQFRQSVLAAAFRGDLTADWQEKNPDVEPASALLERIRTERQRRWEQAELENMKSKGKTPKYDLWKAKYKEPTRLEEYVPVNCPDSWTWARAEEVCDFITKGTTPAAQKMFEKFGDVPFIKVYNLTDCGALDFSINPTFVSKDVHNGELARSKVFPGDVLMNIVGPPLGKVAIAPDDYKEWNMNQAIAVYRAMPGIESRFLCYCLLSTQILSVAVHAAKATAGQFNLTLEICRDLPLPIPPTSEQQQIVAMVDRFFAAADLIAERVDNAVSQNEVLNQSILAKAFRGELVPQDPNDEPASVLLERIRAERAKREAEAKTAKKSTGKTSKQRSRKAKQQDSCSIQLGLPGVE